MKKKLESEEIKRIQVSILDEFVGFCKEYNLRYFIMFGTLLGAVRHKGFIPWDDDIDVVMPRKDYDRFISEYYSIDNTYVLNCPERNEDYPYTSAKLYDSRTEVKEYRILPYKIGVNIDIFPLDDVGSDVVRLRKFIFYLKIVGKLADILAYDNSYPRKAWKRVAIAGFKLIFNKIDLNTLLKTIIKSTKKLYQSDSKFCATYVAAWAGWKQTFKKEWFGNESAIEFEGKEYMAPMQYDKVLRHLYGDYMQLPPKSEQVTHHTFDAWRVG